MDTRFSRRQLLRHGVEGAAVLSGLSFLAACGTSSTASVSANATITPGTLNLVFWGATLRDQLTRKTIGLFDTAHAGVTINSSFTDFTSYWPKLNTQIAGGNEPDIIQMDMRYIKQFVTNGLLADLKPFVNTPIDLSDFDKNLLDGTRVNGELYGVPAGGNYQTDVYDTTLIQKAGVGPVPTKMTWEQYATYCQQLHQALGTYYGTQDMSHIMTAFEVFVREHNGLELYTSDGKLGFDRSVVVEWFTYWQGMRQSGGCVPPDVEKAFDGTAGPQASSLINGKAVFAHTLSNLFDAYQGATKNALAMTPLPTYSGANATPGMYLKASMLWSVGAKSKFQFDSASFIGFTINDPTAVTTLGVERGIPGSAKAQALLKPNLTPTQQAQVTYINLVAANGLATPKKVLDPSGAGAVETALINAAFAVAFGQKTPDTGADQFMSDAQTALSQA